VESESLKLFEGINPEKAPLAEEEEEKQASQEEVKMESGLPEANLQMKVRMIPMNK
jgi:hypothetical protein